MAGAGATRPRIGLALGGGAAQGFAHIAVLEVLEELGLRPDAITATSMGAVLGAAYAGGMCAAEIRTHAEDVFRSQSEFLRRIWRSRPRKIRELSIGVGQYDLERVLRAFLPQGFPTAFSDLVTPFRCVATDYYSGDQAVLSEGLLIPAIAASAAVPVLFRPVRIGGRIMVDGNLCNPVPFDLLDDVDLVIASDVVTEPLGDSDRVPGAFEALFGSASILMRSLMTQRMKASRPPDVLIRLPAAAGHILDFTNARSIMRQSEASKEDIRSRVSAALDRKRGR